MYIHFFECGKIIVWCMFKINEKIEILFYQIQIDKRTSKMSLEQFDEQIILFAKFIFQQFDETIASFKGSIEYSIIMEQLTSQGYDGTIQSVFIQRRFLRVCIDFRKMLKM
jgi:hypothetical protein